VLLLVLGSAAAGGYALSRNGAGRGEPPYRVVALDRGPLTASVRATGTLTPVSTVLVGSQLSGQIVEILVDFNSPVKAGQVVARLFSEQIRARREGALAEVAAARADLEVRRAQIERARATRLRADATLADLAAQATRAAATLAEGERALERQRSLFGSGSGARAGLDAARTQVEVQRSQLASVAAQTASARAEIAGIEADITLADAQAKASEAVLRQRQARLSEIEIDLANTDIRSPVDGVVVNRQIELGQTVAASLSAPTLFTIARDLTEIDIYANVDEADVGRIREGQRVTFSVNAYPNRSFEGAVKLVRLGAQTVQNVVTYTGVIRVRNADLALMPGMTANLQIITDQRGDVLRAPNAALRFRPVTQTAVVAAPEVVDDAGPFAGPALGAAGQAQARALQALRERLVETVKPTVDELAAVDRILAETRTRLQQDRQGASPEENRRNAQAARRDAMRRIGEALEPARRDAFLKAVQAQAAAGGAPGGASANGPRRQRQTTPGRVYVLGEDGQPRGIDVRLGVSDGAMTEIVAGEIEAGAAVIIGGGPPRLAQPTPQTRGPRLF
jgi:HlyD family secretion protein